MKLLVVKSDRFEIGLKNTPSVKISLSKWTTRFGYKQANWKATFDFTVRAPAVGSVITKRVRRMCPD